MYRIVNAGIVFAGGVLGGVAQDRAKQEVNKRIDAATEEFRRQTTANSPANDVGKENAGNKELQRELERLREENLNLQKENAVLKTPKRLAFLPSINGAKQSPRVLGERNGLSPFIPKNK